jgi:hypothetical protein
MMGVPGSIISDTEMKAESKSLFAFEASTQS